MRGRGAWRAAGGRASAAAGVPVRPGPSLGVRGRAGVRARRCAGPQVPRVRVAAATVTPAWTVGTPGRPWTAVPLPHGGPRVSLRATVVDGSVGSGSFSFVVEVTKAK